MRAEMSKADIERLADEVATKAWAERGYDFAERALGDRERALADWRQMIRLLLQALREPTDGMLEAARQTPGIREIDAMISFNAARNRSHVLKWDERGEPAPLSQAFTAMIDHLLDESE